MGGLTKKESDCWESAQIWHDKFRKAEAEIERLRAALIEVRNSKMPGESRAIAIRALDEQATQEPK